MNDDLTLLREFVQSNFQDAFAALASRHVHLVYSVAMRRVRDMSPGCHAKVMSRSGRKGLE